MFPLRAYLPAPAQEGDVVLCRYLLSYRVHGGCEAAIGELFVERVGKVVVCPYFRATVAQLTAQSAAQMPPLPIVSLAPRSVRSATELEDKPRQRLKRKL